ncbi:MAG: hypothetical protein NZ571_15495, partial [Anaerolineae bacterium]|nr:hypothetical protein [Anaerolineae bacterium]
MSSKALNRLYDLSIFLLVVSFLLVVPTPIFVNDDTFVYFNYARNFAEGRPFAYDPRNIPSEGFTSMLYMLLLVPAEVLRINPVFASSAINILALALSIVWLGQMVRTTGILPSHLAALFTWLLTVFTLSDQNIRELVFAGFESIVGLLCVTGIVVSVAYVLDEQRSAQARRRWMSVFLVAAFLAHLVRPEYLMVGAIGGAVLLWRSPDRGALLRRTAIFAFVMVVYYLFKFAVFGDLFPTGFYRKVRSSELGIAHVTGWVRDYFFCLLAAYFLVRHIPILRKNLV